MTLIGKQAVLKTVTDVFRNGGSVLKHLPACTGDIDSIPGPGRSHAPWGGGAREPPLLACAPRPGSCSYWGLLTPARDSALPPRLIKKK